MKLGKRAYAAIAGMSSHESVFDAEQTCKRVFDPKKSTRDNIESIERDLCQGYFDSIKSQANKAPRFDRTLHIALFGFESELAVISAIKFNPVGSDDPNRVQKEYNLGTECLDPSYVMGRCQAIELDKIAGGILPDIKRVGVKDWLEAAMKESLAPDKHPSLDGMDFVILRVGVDGAEEWLRSSETCSDF